MFETCTNLGGIWNVLILKDFFRDGRIPIIKQLQKIKLF